MKWAHYRSFTTTTSRSASKPRDGTRSFGFSLQTLPLTTRQAHLPGGSIVARLPTFRAGAAVRARAAYMPDTTWPIRGQPPGPSRTLLDCPVSMPSIQFRHFNSGSLALARETVPPRLMRLGHLPGEHAHASALCTGERSPAPLADLPAFVERGKPVDSLHHVEQRDLRGRASKPEPATRTGGGGQHAGFTSVWSCLASEGIGSP
jgi:hypothetical protein